MSAVRQLEYFRVAEESTWGTVGTSWVGIPPDEYSIGYENTITPQDKMTGEIDFVYVDVTNQALQGTFTSQVWPANAATLLAMIGLPRESDNTLLSHSVSFFDYAKGEYVNQLGIVVNSCEISASGGSPKLMFSMDCVGKSEASTSSFGKPTFPVGPAFEIHDATFTIAGSAEPNVSEFSISVSNNVSLAEILDPTTRSPRWVDYGRREVSLSFTVRTDSTMANHYVNLARNRDDDLSFVAAFNYPGTGSPIDTLTFTLGECVIQNAQRTGGTGDIQMIQVTAIAKKPSATDAIVAATS